VSPLARNWAVIVAETLAVYGTYLARLTPHLP